MADEIRKDITLEDGRKAERVTQSTRDSATNESVEVIETFAEQKQPKRLARRQIVRTRPCVYERETQYINEDTGEITNVEKESIDPQTKLEVREKIVAAAAMPEKVDSGHITREELREDIKDAILLLAKNQETEPEKPVCMQSVVEDRIASNNKIPAVTVILLVIAAAELAGLLWYCLM
jgi:hypothetical protein